MTSCLNNGYHVMNFVAKFERFLRHSIILPSFDCRRSNARVRLGGGVCSKIYPIQFRVKEMRTFYVSEQWETMKYFDYNEID